MICLDEPFTALDASLRERLRGDVCEILRSSGTTSILVTHDQAEALSLADRVAVIRGGCVAQVDEPRHLYQYPIDLDVAKFLGRVVELRGVACARNRVSTALGEVSVERDLRDGAIGVLVVRPEQISLNQQATNTQGNATVLDVAYYGHESIIEARLDSGELIDIRAQGACNLQPGALIDVHVSGPACFFENGSVTPQAGSDSDRDE